MSIFRPKVVAKKAKKVVKLQENTYSRAHSLAHIGTPQRPFQPGLLLTVGQQRLLHIGQMLVRRIARLLRLAGKDRVHQHLVLTVDLGFAKKGRNLAAELGVPIAFIEKRRRKQTNAAQALTLIGDTRDRDVIIIDDEVDTAGSMAEAAVLAEENGARGIYSVFVHPVFSDPAVERLAASPITHLITTNTVPIPAADLKTLQGSCKVDVLDISPLLGEVIIRAHEGRSVGEMFDE